MVKWIVAFALVALPAGARAAPVTVAVGCEVYHDEQSGNLIGNGCQTRSVSVRYLGLKAPGQARFERTDATTEDVSNIHNAAAPVLLPPIIAQIAVEMAKDPQLRIDGQTLRIVAATPSSVTYEDGR